MSYKNIWPEEGGALMGLLDVVLKAATSFGNDNGCDWICDNCGTLMNNQFGFNVSSGSWCCRECGSVNDVSENNILDEEDDDDGYFGSCQYYDDEDKRRKEEEDDLRELGIDPYDD